MWPFRVSKAVEEAVEEIKSKAEYMDPYEKELKQRKERMKLIEKAIDSMGEQMPVVDFQSMRVVSIERAIKDYEVQGQKWSVGATVVGYIQNEYGDEGRIKSSYISEWTIYCNEDHHQKLVDDFKKYLNLRQKGEIKVW